MPRKRVDLGLPPKDWGTFGGFYPPLYTPTPDLLFDEVMPYLTGAELKCLLYIVRHTLGFKKDADNLSIDQFVHGILKHDGGRQDWGTGLARSTALEALRSLKERRLIDALEQRTEGQGTTGSTPTLYSLRLRPGTPEHTRGVGSSDDSARKNGTGGVRKNGLTRNKGSRNNTRKVHTAPDYTAGQYGVCAACGERPCTCREAVG